MPSTHIPSPGRTDIGLTAADVRRPRTRRDPDRDPTEHPLVRDFKRDMAALRRQWDLEDEVNWAEAARSFATRVARR